jgi:hypothetical protein
MVCERALQRIEIMEGSGYDAALLAERHILRARRLAPPFGLLSLLLDLRTEVSPRIGFINTDRLNCLMIRLTIWTAT